jgi:FMN reductase
MRWWSQARSTRQLHRLFKQLFDLVEPTALRGKPVLLAATGGGDRHALVIEHQLRPLFGFFEAATLATGVYAAERDFADGAPASPALLERIDRAVDQLARQLGARRPGRVGAQASAGPGPAVMAASSPVI